LSGGAVALAVQDIVLSVLTQARADRRALICAALIGSSFGLGLGATYLASGMGRAAADHIRAERIAEAAQGGFSETMLQREMKGMDAAALKLARAHDRFANSASDSERGLAWPVRSEQRFPVGRHASPLEAARDLDCLTQAVYYEARSEGSRGQAAVAQVVLNRVASPSFPKTVCGVVFQGAATHGCQFSFACDGSMKRGLEVAAWGRARIIAEHALSGVVLADVGKATHYHTVDCQPYWGAQMLRVAQVGLHIFYRTNPHAPVLRSEPIEHAVFVNLPTPPTTIRLSAALIAMTLETSPTAATLQPVSKPAAPAAKASEPTVQSGSSEPAAS
jgi:spore germination cell wall hydrolase CwlJ-like protein